MVDTSNRLKTGMTNLSPLDIGADYPKMLYRPGEVVEHEETGQPINIFHGRPCDTIVAESADHAEFLASEGWETSPAAAYGEAVGIGAAVTAKDARIAELEAMLAAQAGPTDEQVQHKRGPGRPPRSVEQVEA